MKFNQCSLINSKNEKYKCVQYESLEFSDGDTVNTMELLYEADHEKYSKFRNKSKNHKFRNRFYFISL